MMEAKEIIIEEQNSEQVDDVKYVDLTDPYGFIYITTNLVNGKRYLGQATFNKNWKTYLGSGTILKRAIKLYGREKFTRDIILICCSEEELNQAEYDLSIYLNVAESIEWYNIVPGGGTTRGFKFSEEQKRKMSEMRKGRVLSAETRRRMSDGKKGSVVSLEAREKISKANKGRLVGDKNPMYGISPKERMNEDTYITWLSKITENASGENNPMYGKRHSEATREKIREKLTGNMVGEKNPFYGNKHSEETKEYLRQINTGEKASKETRELMSKMHTGKNNANAHPLYCYELDEFFWGQTDVKDKYKDISVTNIALSCKNPNRTCGIHPTTKERLHWRYATMEEYENYIQKEIDTNG